jgi:hypothetical protein
MALRLNGQTTGYTELNAPDNGDSVILTMPGNDGTSGQYLQTDGSGTLSWASVVAGSGRILQIQSTTTNSQVDTTSTSFISTGFGLSITPSSASSKILVLCLASATPNTAGQGIYQKVVRDGTTDASNIVAVYNDSTAADTWRPTFMFGVDSPNTTSSTQYMLYFRALYSSSSVYSNWGGSAPQQMYLLELGQ